MLEIKYSVGKTNKLTMKGHCDSAPKGYDLVCAAASILCLTMAQVLRDNADKLKQEAEITIQDGDASMIWECKEEAQNAFVNCFYTVKTGLELLQHNHPDCIKIENKG